MMDAFTKKKSDSLVAVSHPGTWGPFEDLMLQGRIIAFISFREYMTHRIFHHEVKDGTLNTLHVHNFKRTVMECKQVNFFDPSVRWSRMAKELKLSPTHEKKNSDQRLSFKLDNMLIVKQLFSFGLWTVPSGEGDVFQTSDAPMLIYHLPSKSLQCQPKLRTMRRRFVEQDQYLFDRYVMHLNSIYVVPPETRYLILTVQKTLFAVDEMAWEDVRGLQDFRTHRQYTLPAYNLPPPTPKHEMQVPDIIRPEERRSRKRMRRNSPEPVFIRPRKIVHVLRDPESETVVQIQPVTFVLDPTHDPEPEPTQVQMDPDPEPEPTQASQEDVLIFQDDWMNIKQQDVCQETINDFLANLERELCSTGPAHQIHVERPPAVHQPPNVSVVLPPPPDNYWGSNETLPTMSFRDTSANLFDESPPMDLTLEARVALPRQTQVFKPGPLDLSCKLI
ncbi:hypothetical protein HNY73_021523 [Argiope bruennichi]|uniref:Uncharacterized protein n=1 Tax=Argiope bruennichi TaxID=94029 RepID=A0A8T0DXS8_ARGBR|nr:hypothetical protein HNY73_021523 [Argiope bruennichi]